MNKQLGPYKKYIVAAAIIQSIIVIVVGYVLFKSKLDNDPAENIQDTSAVEQPLNSQ